MKRAFLTATVFQDHRAWVKFDIVTFIFDDPLVFYHMQRQKERRGVNGLMLALAVSRLLSALAVADYHLSPFELLGREESDWATLLTAHTHLSIAPFASPQPVFQLCRQGIGEVGVVGKGLLAPPQLLAVPVSVAPACPGVDTASCSHYLHITQCPLWLSNICKTSSHITLLCGFPLLD